MKWVHDKDKIGRVFEDCFKLDLRANNCLKKLVIKHRFVKRLQDQSLTNRQKLIQASHLFDNSRGSFSRERFFEICFFEELIDKELLTDLYLSVHTQARPYAYFKEEILREIFQNINLPIKCFEVNQDFDELPEIIKVYRGLRTYPNNLNSIGYCWTLNKIIAKKFATGDCQVPGFIVSGKIEKYKVLSLVLSRDEEEIITFSESIQNIEIEHISC